MQFHDGQYQFKVPFKMYVDFESTLEPLDGFRPDPDDLYMDKINRHIPSDFCVYSKFAYGEVKEPLKIYRGADCVGQFCKYIKEEVIRLYNMFPEKPMEPLTSEEWKEYNLSNKCHICSKRIEDIKVRDHCHYTGKYRGPVHRDCNLKYKIPSYIPIMFHNLSEYDAHLFIRELGRLSNKIGVIIENKEKCISFKTEVVIGEYVDKKGEIKIRRFNFKSSIA